MTDRDLKAAVEHQLSTETRLAGKAIDVDVQEGNVILRGRLPDIAEKRLAVNVVRLMKEVGSVRDQLRLLTANELTDRQIEMHIRDAWQLDMAIHEQALEVMVRDGIATLTGKLDNVEEKRLAGLCAWWVPGVADVENLIDLTVEQPFTEGDLVDSIRQALEKDVLVNEDLIGVSVRGSLVTLVGSAHSEEERMAAEHDAYYVWGVKQVINQIEINPR